MNSSDTPLLKYHLVFVACYFAGSLVSGLVASGAKSTGALGLVVILLSAFIALRMFCKDHGRGLDQDERWRMLRTGVIILAAFGFLGFLLIKLAYDAAPINVMLGRKFPGWMVPVGTLVVAALAALQLWVVYYLFNERAYPGSSAADALAPAAASARPGAGPAVRAKLRVLVLGDDAAAHAIAWRYAHSPRVLEVLVAPGNAGTANESKCRNINLASDDVEALVALVRRESVDLTVACAGAPLADGLVDRLRALDLRVLGPRAASLRLAEPGFARDFLSRHAIATAAEHDPGRRVRAMHVVDGWQAVPLLHAGPAEGDGARGDCAPAPGLPAELPGRIAREILEPLMVALAREDMEWHGFLGLDLAVGPDGTPKVVAIHPWPTAPEAPLAMMRLQADLAGLSEAALDGRVGQLGARANPNPCLAIGLVAQANELGSTLHGLERRPPLEVKVFHSGTRQQPGRIELTGTEVLTVCALGSTLAECRMSADDVLERISWAAQPTGAPA